ncbi:GNAT family N-acetyltransferase [Haliangium sp. UPWRP_2]|uniref:GNAT family N-acetyltransferase n=1 Tax=Haliangium sp. UPWRP_2 TaxID=1931276 RepID=UPI0011B2126E|nr:GNAT family N-acetyltransferase [Haliangium sp. UPWRP_2]
MRYAAHMLFADGRCAARIEGAEGSLTRAVAMVSAARKPAGEVYIAEVAGGVAVHIGEPAPFNKLIGLGLGGPLGPADWDRLSAVEAEFQRRRTPLQAEVCTLADGALLQGLTRRGYQLVAFENVLGRALSVADLTPEPAFGLRTFVAQPDDAASSSTWLDAVVTGFAHPDPVPGGPSHESFPREVIAAAMADLVVVPGFARYVAELTDSAGAARPPIIAGGASLRLCGGIAQLCGSATLPGLRRRGVQSALLAARLADAARAGCDLAVITTQPGSKSQHNAQRAGFTLLYSRAILVRQD